MARAKRSLNQSRSRTPATFGLFVEGTTPTDQEGTYFLTKLWQELAAQCGYSQKVEVYGFSKSQIELLHVDADPKGIASLPLDLLISARQRQDAFEHVIIAFDRTPKNSKIPYSSVRTEIDWILDRFIARGRLPTSLLADSLWLRRHYAKQACPPRVAGRPPRTSLELLCMDPMFESMLVSDAKTVRVALGIVRTPKDWPDFDTFAAKPDQTILPQAISFASDDVRRKVRGTFKNNKHGWALEIVRHARNQVMLKHAIPDRLRTLFK